MRRQPSRPGSMRWGINAFLLSALALTVLIALLFKSRPDPDRSPLFVYCAAGLKGPIEEIARQFEKEEDVEIQLSYGGSGEQLASARISERGDLFIPADLKYIKQAREQNLLEEDITLASMHPTLAVQKGNPKNITSLDDLLKKDVTIAQANPEVAAVGTLTRQALRKINRWDPLHKKSVYKGTEPLVASDIRLGAVDAGFLWDATVTQHQEHLEAVPLPELRELSSNVTLGVLKSSKSPASALRFARYLSARDKGVPIFKKHGFKPIEDGDLWAEGDPEINLHVGAMLRPAVEATIRDFERREGLSPGNIRINYNGCGVLVTAMKAGERPDGFFACDANYLNDPLEKDAPEGKKIKDLFLDTTEISTNRLVILVHKGNPKKIRQMGDLTRKGVRIGVGDEHKCAMGALTQETFRQGKIRDKVHIVVRSGTGDLLVNQFTAAPDEMDAIVVYKSNAKRVEDKFDSVPIDEKCAIVAQPIAAGIESNHKHLVERLIRAIKSSESRKRFEENDFIWKATK